MKIIIPTNGDSLEDKISNTFGRTKNFLLVDNETMEFKLVKNTQNRQAAQGAGIQSAQLAAKEGADAIITMHCGPKAYRVLMETGIPIYCGKMLSINENIQKLKEGTLEKMADSNVEGHWT